jgi:hypothetical protein
MKKLKSKTMTIVIALFLTISMSTSIILQPTANAHSPSWKIPTYAYLSVTPSPVGVGQHLAVVAFVNWPLPGSTIDNNIRFNGYAVTVTKPNGSNQTLNMPTTDPTSSSYVQYIPDQVGTYTFVFSHPDLLYTWSGTYQNDTFLGSISKAVNVTVQEQPVAEPTTYPLPTNYWTRPIEGQNTNWFSIASNWLGSPYIAGNTQHAIFQPDGSAPNSAHVMWTYRLSDAGVVGGSGSTTDNTPGNTFYQGLTYNPRFLNPIIMDGRLFFDLPFGNAGSGGGYQALDLTTGQPIWWLNDTSIGTPSFGYYYDLEWANQHGIMPDGTLFTSNFATAIDPRTGTIESLNITNVPSGYPAVGSSGEIIRYAVNTAGHWLAQWNSSKLIDLSGTIPNFATATINASLPSRYDWNITLPAQITSSTSIQYAQVGDILLGGTAFAAFSSFLTPDPYTMWAINLNASRGAVGSLMWLQTYAAPPGNVTRRLACVDPLNRVFIFGDKETFTFSGYSLDNGNFMWQTKPIPGDSDFEYYDLATVGLTPCTAYSYLYNAGWGGLLSCYDTKNGNLLWTYGNGGEGNSTNSGLATAWGHYPLFIYSIADGKVYMMSSEHSPNTPMWRGGLARAVDAYTGKEIFTLDAFGGQLGREGTAVADGYWVYYNYYDGQLYCIGKGPSSLTVTAPDVSIELHKSLVIRGSVTDVSAGIKQNRQAGDFPNGVPCVSDASMGEWMDYVYMQKPRPTNATGVPVSIDVIDSNGNYRNIGNATSDSSGVFSFQWTPDIPGKYTVIAAFAGSESYWPSYSETSFAVDPTGPTASPYPIVNLPPTEIYFAISTVAIITAIAIGFVIVILMFRKRQ